MNLKIAQKYYTGFYIDSEEGNNAFSLNKRKQKKIYIAPLIEEKINTLEVGKNIAFSEIDDGIEKKCLGLNKFLFTYFKNTPVFIFDNHNHAFFFWMFALQQGLITKQLPLVHIDQHKDMRDPKIYLPNLKLDKINLDRVFHYTNYVLNVGNFIVPALKMDIFSKVDIIDDSISLTKNYSERVVLDIDIDFFSEEMGYIPFEDKLDFIHSLLEYADLITIATSPYFIEQKQAIEIIKKIFKEK